MFFKNPAAGFREPRWTSRAYPRVWGTINKFNSSKLRPWRFRNENIPSLPSARYRVLALCGCGRFVLRIFAETGQRQDRPIERGLGPKEERSGRSQKDNGQIRRV